MNADSPNIRTEKIGDSTLYCGDCRIVMAYVRADVLLTDPPYGIDGGRGGDARDFGKSDYRAGWHDTEDYVLSVCAPAVQTALGLVQRGAITPGPRCLTFYPRSADMGCFWAPAAITHGPWGFTTFQPILYYGRDFRAGRGAWPAGRTSTEAAAKNGHPCPKPEIAWRWLMEKVSKPGEVVLDPFMGSGTTGVVCAKAGRRFIGIEIEPRYFDIACRRIEEAQRQGDLLNALPPAEDPADTRMADLFAGAARDMEGRHD